MKRFMLISCALLLLPAAALHAQEPRPLGSSVLEATAGNDVLQLRYLTPSPLTSVRSDLDYGLLLSEERDIIASAALMFRTNLHIIPHLTLEVGPQAYLADLAAEQKTDVMAAAFGASARYVFVLYRWPIAAFGSAFYSPSVLTFGSADNLYDFSAGGEIGFTPRLSGLAGYRWLKFTTVGEPNVRVDNELFAGLSWKLPLHQ